MAVYSKTASVKKVHLNIHAWRLSREDLFLDDCKRDGKNGLEVILQCLLKKMVHFLCLVSSL